MAQSPKTETLGTRTASITAVVLIYHALAFLAILGWFSLSGNSSLQLSSLLRFDALHYQWISEHGYEGFRQAFFPLFPLTWRALGTYLPAAILLNSCLYLLVLIVLARSLATDIKTVLVWCSLPSVIFYFAPYTESMFATGAAILLLGFRQDRLLWMGLGMFICTLSRPAFTALLPAALTAIWLARTQQRSIFRGSLSILTGAITGLIVVILIQHADTGSWFGFFKAQEGWGNELSIPSLPLTSWGGGRIVMLDSAALLFGVTGLIYMAIQMFHRLSGITSSLPPNFLLSVSYIAFISLIILMIHKGSIYSLNRFVFATPFFLVIIDQWLRSNHVISRSHFIGGMIMMTMFFLLFGSFVHIQTFLKFIALAVFIGMGVSLGSVPHSRGRFLFPLYIIVAFCIQTYFAIRFLEGDWVA